MFPLNARLALLVPFVASLSLECGGSSTASLTTLEQALTSAPSLATGQAFSVLGGQTVTNTGPTTMKLGQVGDAIQRADGDAEDDSDDDDDFIRVRAQQGFAISPVEVDLSGRSHAQIRQIGYGSYLMNATSLCGGCHSSAQGFLAGGRGFVGNTVFARNLTPDTTGMQLTEAQFIEAIRTGRDFQRDPATQLRLMPWPFLRWTSLADLKAMYAYLRAIPPITHQVQASIQSSLSPVPFPDTFNVGEVDRRLPGDTGRHLRPEYDRGLAISALANPRDFDHRRSYARGSYIVNTVGACADCHSNPFIDTGTTEDLHLNIPGWLAGGHLFKVPNVPEGPESRVLTANLTGETLGFFHQDTTTFDIFRDTIRLGIHADENPPRPLAGRMPWEFYRNMVDGDLRAIHVYLTSVAPRVPPNDKELQDYARLCVTDASCNVGETCFLNLVTNVRECIGAPCTKDLDCGACQTCGGDTCQPATAASIDACPR